MELITEAIEVDNFPKLIHIPQTTDLGNITVLSSMN